MALPSYLKGRTFGTATPAEEIVQNARQPRSRDTIRCHGFSDIPAWLAMIAAERRALGPILMQLEYSLVARDIKSEHFSTACEDGIGFMPWNPLAGGFLTSKFNRNNASNTGRLSGGDNPFGGAARKWDVLAVAKELGRLGAQVTLA
jgi:aryl-alcohol dehydrogenase-like predicted oxidoreductase